VFVCVLIGGYALFIHVARSVGWIDR